jgi:hypothetical protein
VYVAAGAIALAAIASLHHDLAIDEPFTALAIARPDTLGATLVHDNLPLYYALLLGWTRLWGTSALALRALSMIAFGGAIVFTASTAQHIAGRTAGTLAAALVAASVPFGLQPAATVRPYALVTMFGAMTLWAAVREARRTLFLAHLMGLLTHPVFVFFSLASAAAGAARGTRRRLFVGTPLAAVAVYAATWGVMLARTAALPATSWMSRPTSADVITGLLFWGDRATQILAFVALVLFAVRGTQSTREHASWIAWLVLLAALVLGGTIGVSMVRPVYLASRTPVLVLPAAAIAVAVVISDMAPLLVMCALMALVAASAIRFTVRSATRPDPYPTRASLAALAPRMRCGDTIIAAGLSYAPVVYYGSTAGVPSCVTLRAFPADVAQHPGWLDLTTPRRSAYAREAGSIASSVGVNNTLWAFIARRGLGADAGAALIDALARIRSEPETIGLTGSFFDQVVAFHGSGTRPRHP